MDEANFSGPFLSILVKGEERVGSGGCGARLCHCTLLKSWKHSVGKGKGEEKMNDALVHTYLHISPNWILIGKM